jgi:large subunit ribosomal protein LP0
LDFGSYNGGLGNVGFVFTNEDLKEIREVIVSNKVAAPARAGAVAPADVYVPAGNTGMEPGKTSFFQALGVPTKIARGTIEITTDLKLVEAGGKVGPSEATLLNMLNISPFTYGMSIAQVYDDGQCFASSVLDIDEDDLLKSFFSAIQIISAISLAANYPTLPSVAHSLINSYKKVVAAALEIDYSWEAIDGLKDRIANPDAYAAAAPVAGTEGKAEEKEAKAEEKEEEAEESEEEGLLLSHYLHCNTCLLTYYFRLWRPFWLRNLKFLHTKKGLCSLRICGKIRSDLIQSMKRVYLLVYNVAFV